MNAPLTKLQTAVFRLAKERLENESWYNGVSMDDFPTNEDIECNGISDSAWDVYYTTWDEPIKY
jgi:hypothetical protein